MFLAASMRGDYHLFGAPTGQLRSIMLLTVANVHCTQEALTRAKDASAYLLSSRSPKIVLRIDAK